MHNSTDGCSCLLMAAHTDTSPLDTRRQYHAALRAFRLVFLDFMIAARAEFHGAISRIKDNLFPAISSIMQRQDDEERYGWLSSDTVHGKLGRRLTRSPAATTYSPKKTACLFQPRRVPLDRSGSGNGDRAVHAAVACPLHRAISG